MKTVVVLGASADRAKFGNKAVRAYAQRGFDVYPVNLKESVIEGHAVFKSLRDVPVRPDLVSVYLPPATLLGLLPEIAAKGCDELWLNPGSDSPEVVEKARSMGLNVVQACSIVDLGISPRALADK